MCIQCMKTYSCQSNLNRHHKENRQFESAVIAYDKSIKMFKCLEGCNISFTLNVDLILNLKNIHDINPRLPTYVKFTYSFLNLK